MNHNEVPLSYIAALKSATEKHVDNQSTAAHTAYIGYRERGGQLTDEICVVVTVPQKQPFSALSEGEMIPAAIQVGGTTVPVDVREAPPPQVELLMLMPGMETQAGLIQTQCHSPTVPGGSQIQPQGANWVGTLGCMVEYKVNGETRYGALTNAHVTGLTQRAGYPIMQPTSANSRPFAVVHDVAKIDVSQSASNLVDMAVLDCKTADGHTCTPNQLGIGKLGKQLVNASLGMRVVKSGRTTGVTRGKCVGIRGVSLVGYGGRTPARFVDLDVYRGDSGDLSAAGDSGSAILRESDNSFASLLFAGGGGQTLACPSRNVFKLYGLKLYQGA